MFQDSAKTRQRPVESPKTVGERRSANLDLTAIGVLKRYLVGNAGRPSISAAEVEPRGVGVKARRERSTVPF